MRLYYSPGACSLAPHIALHEAGATFEAERVDIPKKKTETGADFWQINPKGYVPALQLDDGEVLTEVGVILQYIADRKPESGLAPPAGTMARYHLMEWLNFIATEVHKQIGALFNPQLTPEMKEVQKAVIARRLDALEKMLGSDGWLAGAQFTVADAYLCTVFNWTKIHKLDTSKWPKLEALIARIAARPKVQAAMKAEGLVKS
ncbi:MAG: glutathione transferase GstA [Burkholderiales bacterium]|nr:glutathione transferase GstA [Burkholderiales bacterium]